MDKEHCHLCVSSRLFVLISVLAGCLVSLEASGFDIERFLALDRSEIRAAERQLDRLLDAYQQDPTAMSLSEAEHYVIERELYWRTAAAQVPQARTLEDGTTLIKLHPATMNSTFLGTDVNGFPIVGCAASGHGQLSRELEISPLKSGVVR